MAYERPTLTTIIDRIISDIETRVTGIGSLFRRSMLKVLAKVYGGALHLSYGFLSYMADQLFVLTADDNYINVHATEFGLSKEAGVKATGTGTVTGTATTVIPISSKLQSTDGLIYLTDAEVTIPASGSTTVNFTADEVGSDYNDDASVVFTFVSPISGVDTTVTVSGSGVTGGTDEETVDELRERILNRKRLPPHGGAVFDYVTWMKEVSGVTRAWAFDQYMGNGTVGLSFVRDNDASIYPNQSRRDEVEEYLESHTDPASGETVGIPVGASGGMTVLETEAYSVDFTIKLYPNTTVVQTAVETELEDLLLRDGGPGETLYLSNIAEAISAADGEIRHEIVSPTYDVACSYTQVPLLGIVTFEDFD